jgi:hypothetical protein
MTWQGKGGAEGMWIIQRGEEKRGQGFFGGRKPMDGRTEDRLQENGGDSRTRPWQRVRHRWGPHACDCSLSLLQSNRP